LEFFVVYIDTGCLMPISPSKSRDLADEHNTILTEWKWFETTVFWLPLWYHQTLLVSQCKAYVGYSVLRSRYCFMNVLYLLWCRWVTLYFGNPDFPPPDYCICGKRLKKKVCFLLLQNQTNNLLLSVSVQ
jgi:hypothetical protein